MILAGSNLTQDGLYSFSISFVKGKNTIPSPTNFLGRVGSASNALHTGSQVLINSSKPNEGCKSKIRGANPKQLVCKQVILVVSMSVSPAEMIAQNRALRGPYPHSSCCEIIGKQENKNVTKSRNLKIDKVLSVF